MTSIPTVKLGDTENAENFRSRSSCIDEVNRIRWIEKSEKLTKSINARLLKNMNCKKNFHIEMFDVDRTDNALKSQ